MEQLAEVPQMCQCLSSAISEGLSAILYIAQTLNVWLSNQDIAVNRAFVARLQTSAQTVDNMFVRLRLEGAAHQYVPDWIRAFSTLETQWEKSKEYFHEMVYYCDLQLDIFDE